MNTADLTEGLEKGFFFLNTPLWFKYQMVSASFRNFLPELDYRQHRRLFDLLMRNQQLAHQEQKPSALKGEVMLNFSGKYTLEDLRERPGIIATFHSGSFRLIGHLFVKEKVPFSLLVAGDGLEKEDQMVSEQYGKENLKSFGFDLINANRENALLKMCRELRAGKNILVYLDGNTGANGHSENRNLILLRFLYQRIRVRAGAAYAAYLTEAPIYPVISTRRWKYRPRLDFFPPVIPDRSTDRATFVEMALKRLYGYLEDTVKEKPWQWNGWLHLHRHAEIINPVPEQIRIKSMPKGTKGRYVMFNERDYAIFSTDDLYFLLRKKDYACFEIKNWRYHHIYNVYMGNSRLTVPMARRNNMEDLLDNGVLIEK
ncbi:hypothetical protein [Olivibacter jilunii]|uniref:hypothetical protein n=1 Tax=Olivibacter jilunii TaxID=985016 RepID=UPI0013EF4FE1|nr:hypothetical protein [Olivibacter jilunii]